MKLPITKLKPRSACHPHKSAGPLSVGLQAGRHRIIKYFNYSIIMETKAAAAGFAALSQETRLQLMRVLAARGASGMAAGELAAALGLAPSTLSFHLAALEQARLVHSTRQGRYVIYAVRFAGLRALFSFLTETCCSGRPDLSGDLARLIPEDADEMSVTTPVFNVLFICTRNSARSIMAEAILEKISRGKFNAYSAGSTPADAPMPEVLERLKVMGHNVSRLRSKSWNEFAGPDAPRMDFVLTLCDPQDGEVCPDLGVRPISAVWPFPDPVRFRGSDIERTTLLTELYGMIRRRLEGFTNLPFQTLDRMALKARLDALGSPATYMR
jgi:ArsR family transcriptional regulator, arsenate/arsenite/antimonite-responsive transcriptional repressor / arsenate reductase (thioredoxin)